jgi:peptidoglycan/LPS O-acetylase OafA/YrhL
MILPLLLRLSNGLTWQGFRSFYVLSFLGYLVVCIGLSVASFYWVEAPARRWIKSKFRPNRKKTVTSASASAAATVTPYRIAGAAANNVSDNATSHSQGQSESEAIC